MYHPTEDIILDANHTPTEGCACKIEKVRFSDATKFGLENRREEDPYRWYNEVVRKAELIDSYDVAGCYVLRPYAYAIWEMIQHHFDAEIKKMGVQNVYFPMFVKEKSLMKERHHVAKPEVAWVTRCGEKELDEELAIRPTSETIMYPTFARWIQSYRDLPIRVNQWCNVVRWETKNQVPFLRTREFLWQEGHTVHASQQDALEEMHSILNAYANMYENLLAVPVIQGLKTDKEKFAGVGTITTTIEVLDPATGRGIQAATSHHLNQTFSKRFHLVYDHPETGKPQLVYQNSWGMTTRSIGVMTLIHSDNLGLVLPPRVAKTQVIVFPADYGYQSLDEQEKTEAACKEIAAQLQAQGVRAESDVRRFVSTEWKQNYWELKGIPIRIELKSSDLRKLMCSVLRRDEGSSVSLATAALPSEIPTLLERIQSDMFERAKKLRDSRLLTVDHWTPLLQALNGKCIVQAPFCGSVECEEAITRETSRDQVPEFESMSVGAKSLCIPFTQPSDIGLVKRKCVYPECSRDVKFYTLFGRSY